MIDNVRARGEIVKLTGDEGPAAKYFVPAEIVQSDGERMVLRAGALEVAVSYRGDLPQGAMLVLRPHAMSLADAEDPRPGLKGFVVKATYLGTHAEYRCLSACARGDHTAGPRLRLSSLY